MKLGEPMKDEFLLDKSVVFVNHGSYGPAPKCVVEQRIKFIYEQESQPDVWFRFSLYKYYDEALAAGAEFLGVKKENLALVDNVTTAINTVVKGLTFEPGDKILIQTHTYNAVRNIMLEQHDMKGVEVVTVDIPIPIKSEDHIVEVFRKAFEANPGIKLAVFDHISSSSAIVFPVKRLIKLAREHGSLTLIDGAHAPGQIILNIEELGADFYGGNFHKWCYVPRSCGFIWFSDPYTGGKIRPLVTSHGYGKTMNEQYNKLGTRDTSNQLSLPYALKFYKDIGGLEAIQAHAKEMLDYGSKLLMEAFGTEVLDIPESMKAPYMRCVRLPIDKPAEQAEVDEMTAVLGLEYKIQSCFTVIDEKFWVRLSCNVYANKDDYLKLKEALIKYLPEKFEVQFQS